MVKLEEITKPEHILKLSRDDFGQKVINYLFGNVKGIGARFKRTTELIIPINTYYGNKTPIKTSMGNYVVNLILYNENIYKIIGYINKRFSGDVIESNEKKIASALLESKLTTLDVIDYLNRVQFYGFGLNSMISVSLTKNVMFELPQVRKRKEELYKQYKKEIDEGNIFITDKIEKELLSLAKDILKDDPGMELYDSGSKASFKNNYKLTNIMKGATLDLETGKYRVSMSNYQEGVKKEENELFANAMTMSEYAKGVGTRDGGHATKKNNAAFQSLVIDFNNNDCGSEVTFDITVNNFNKKLLTHRYIKLNGKPFELTEENINKFEGKVIHLYDPIYCTGEKICKKCAGNLYVKLNIEALGLTVSKISSTIMNKSLKKKHDNTIKLYQLKDITDDLVL